MQKKLYLIGCLLFCVNVQAVNLLDIVGASKMHEKGIKGAGNIIMVIDDGFDLDHPDYKDQIISTECAPVSIKYTESLKTETYAAERNRIEDAICHGTHIAGIIAQIAPDANILPVDINYAYENMLQLHACTKNYDITAVSISSGSIAGHTIDIRRKLELLHLLVQEGIPVFKSAGNDRQIYESAIDIFDSGALIDILEDSDVLFELISYYCVPSLLQSAIHKFYTMCKCMIYGPIIDTGPYVHMIQNWEHVKDRFFLVGAMDYDNDYESIASYSARSGLESLPFIFAPGEIKSSHPLCEDGVVRNGTSMATPCVAACYVLLRQSMLANNGADYQVDDIVAKLKSCCRKTYLNSSNFLPLYCGHGVVRLPA
jgi:subtilase family protein